MNGRELLQQYRDTEAQIRRLEQELEEARSQAERVTHSYSPAPGGGGDGRQLEHAAIRLEDLEREWRRLVGQQAARYIQMERVLDQLPNARDRLLLRLRYVSRMSWPQVGDELGVTLRYVHRLHGKLLALLDDQG